MRSAHLKEVNTLQQHVRVIVMRHLLVLSLIVGISCVFAAPAAGAIVNGDFESGTAPWVGFGIGVGCDLPHLYTPAATGEGGLWVAWLGDDPATPAQAGCDPSLIYQSFDCDGPGNICQIEFDALFAQTTGEVAYVYLRTDAGAVRWYIPRGFSNDVRVAAPCLGPDCGTALVAFVVYDALDVTAGVQSMLVVDNVESTCLDLLPFIRLDECAVEECQWSDADDPNDPPVAPFTGVVTTGACCGPDDCLTVPPEPCEPSGYGKYMGDDTLCEEECPDPIPAVSEWGMAVLVLLLLTAATVVIARRKTVPT